MNPVVRNRGANTAFTLLEVLVALAIFAIVLSLLYGTWRILMQSSSAGLRLAGMLQKDERRPDRRRCDMTLVDLASGVEIALSQDRGRDARGCRLDHGALEEAAGRALGRLADGPLPELLLLSKFGKREIEGHGFRQVIERAVEAGVPVIVGVTADHVEGFHDFGGGLETVVEAIADAEAIVAALAAAREPPPLGM